MTIQEQIAAIAAASYGTKIDADRAARLRDEWRAAYPRTVEMLETFAKKENNQ